MALTASGTLVVCDVDNNRLRRVYLNNGQVPTIEHSFESPCGVANSSDGTLYVAAEGGVYDIRSADGIVSLLAPAPGFGDNQPMSFHLDEPNGLLYVATCQKLFTVSVRTAGERRADRIFSRIAFWTLTQRDRAEIAPATGIVGVDEGNIREERGLCLRIMRLRVIGVFGLVLRFAFD
jgi:hypothetical protein